MADAMFSFDTNIEAVVRRVRTGLQEIGRTVAQQASAAGASPAQTQQLEQNLQRNVTRAQRELAQIRQQYRDTVETQGPGAASPTGRQFRAEAQRIVQQVQDRMVADLREIGRVGNIPKGQIDQAILQGTAAVGAAMKEIYSQAAEQLRVLTRAAGGTPAQVNALVGTGGLDPAKRASRFGVDEAALRAEISAQAPRMKPSPQDLRQADLDLGLKQVQDQFRSKLRNGINASTAPDEAAQIINSALLEATRAYARRVRQANAGAEALGAPPAAFATQGVDPGLRQLFGLANRRRVAEGLTDQPGFSPSNVLPQGVGGAELRNELRHLANSSAHAARANTEEARASQEAARADRQAAVERSKATAGLTPAQVQAARADDRRAQLGAYLERRAGIQGSGVTATSPGFIVRGPGGTGRVYQASRRALGEGSLIDAEGRAQTLARRVSPEREQRLLQEFYEKERVAREKDIAARQQRTDQSQARFQQQQRAEERAAGQSLDAQRQYHQNLRAQADQLGAGLRQNQRSRATGEALGIREQYGRNLDAGVAARLQTGQARNLGGGIVLDQALGRFVQVINGKATLLEGALTSGQINSVNSAVDRLRRETEKAADRTRAAERAVGGAGSGGGGIGGQFASGFAGGFSSRGFGRGGGFKADFAENIGATMGAEARFLLTYRTLMLVQQAITDTVEQYREYFSAVTDLAIASGGAANVTIGFRQELGDLAALVGESGVVAFQTAARGIRAFGEIENQTAEETRNVGLAFAEAAQNLTLLTGQGLAESANEVVAIGKAYDLTYNSLGRVAEIVAEVKALGGFPDEVTTGAAQFGVAAAEAGISLRENLALVSAITAETGQSGAAVGTRLSRVVNTLRGSTGRGLLSGLGIDTGQLPIDQLRELANIYESLGSADQRNVASQLSGIANIREFTVLLQELKSGSRTQQVIGIGQGDGGQFLEEQERILNSASGQITQLLGQFKQLQDAGIEAGLFDFIGVAVQGARPLLETMNSLLDVFNRIPRELRTIVILTTQWILLRRGLAALQAINAGAGAASVVPGATARATLTAARAQELQLTRMLAVAEQQLAISRAAGLASSDAATRAAARNTIALQSNAVAAAALARSQGLAASTGLGSALAFGASRSAADIAAAAAAAAAGSAPGVPRSQQLGRATGNLLNSVSAGAAGAGASLTKFASTTFGAVTIMAGIAITVNEVLQQFFAIRDALEESQNVREESASAFRAGDFETGVDVLRARAAENERLAEGSTFKNALFASLGPLVGAGDFFGRRRVGGEAEDLLARAENAAARAERQAEIDEEAATRGSASVFGFTLQGQADIEQGIQQLRSAGTETTEIFDQLISALERTAAAGQVAGEEFSVLPGGLETLAAQMAESITGLRNAAIGRVEGDIAQPRQTGNVIPKGDEPASPFRRGGTPVTEDQLNYDPGNLALSPEQEQRFNDAVFAEAQAALTAAGIDAVSGGALSPEQISDIAQRLASTYVPADGETREETARIRTELERLIEQQLGYLTDFSARDLTQGEANAIAQFAAQSAGAFTETERLGGASEVEAAQASLGRLRNAASLIEESGEVVAGVLVTAILKAEREVEDARNQIRTAQENLRSAQLPSADVAGRQGIERGTLVRDLQTARRRNDQEDVLRLLAEITELDRTIEESARSRLAAAERSSFDVRDEAGRLGADLAAATRELSATAQYDSEGNQTEAYSTALDKVAELRIKQAQLLRETGQAAARSSIDPRDTLGNARQDLADAQQNLEAQLPGTQEFYAALRNVAEQRLALAEENRRLAAAVRRSQVDPRDTVGNAAADLADARADLAAALPGTVAFFEALRGVQDAQLAYQQALNARTASYRLAQVAPNDAMGQLQAQLANLRDQLATALPNSAEYFDLIASINGLNQQINDLALQTRQAARLAGIDPRDTAREAAANIQTAAENLAASRPGSAEYYQAQRELAEARLAAAEEERRLADAMDLANVRPGDSVGEAAAAVRAAERNLAAQLPGTVAFFEAMRELAEAQQALADTLRARDDARTMSQVFPGSDIQQARAQLEVARRALQAAETGTEEYYQALGDLKEAQVSLARAQSDARGVNRQLGIDLTDPIATARVALENLRDLLRTLAAEGAPADVLNAIRVQIREAQAGLESTIFGERLGTLRDLVDIGAISETEYLAYLEAEKERLLAIQNRSVQQNKQLIEIEQALQAANEGMQGMFNLGEIRVPTPFEVRRAIARALPGLTEIEDAFGTGNSSDPIGVLVNGSIEAVNNLTGSVEDFGGLVEAVLGQLGLIQTDDGDIIPGGTGSAGGSSGSSSAGGGATGLNGQPLVAPGMNGSGAIPMGTFSASTSVDQRTSVTNVQVQIDGADFAKVTAYFDRLLGSQAMDSRVATSGRKF